MSDGVVSLFPSLFDYQFIAIGVLRIALGFLFIRFGYLKLFKEKDRYLAFFHAVVPSTSQRIFSFISVLELLLGILLVVGLYTQGAAIGVTIIMLGAVIIKLRKPSLLRNDIEFYALIGIVALALLFLGPGAFAIDLPL